MKFFILCLILFSASLVSDEKPHRSYFVIWNVGQGQWTTAITSSECLHFDMGGEYFPWRKILQQCADKKNFVFLSHWDWDHIGALSKTSWVRQFSHLCLALRPLGTSSSHKMQILNQIPPCAPDKLPESVKIWSPALQANSNAESHVIRYKDILIPGDSPATQEKLWRRVSWLQDIKILILGHHGSRTSTSEDLLKSLPSLRTGIASARWARYHHPHSAVEYRLHQRRVALLKTEDYGNIWIELAP